MDFQRAFYEIDVEKTGSITTQDLVEYCQRKNYKESMIKKWLFLFDADDTGVITYENFCETLGMIPKKVPPSPELITEEPVISGTSKFSATKPPSPKKVTIRENPTFTCESSDYTVFSSITESEKDISKPKDTTKQKEDVTKPKDVTKQKEDVTKSKEDVTRPKDVTKQKEDVTKSKEDVTKSKEDVTKPKDVTKQKEDVTKSKEDATKSKDVTIKEDVTKLKDVTQQKENVTKTKKDISKPKDATKQKEDVTKPKDATKQKEDVTKPKDVIKQIEVVTKPNVSKSNADTSMHNVSNRSDMSMSNDAVNIPFVSAFKTSKKRKKKPQSKSPIKNNSDKHIHLRKRTCDPDSRNYEISDSIWFHSKSEMVNRKAQHRYGKPKDKKLRKAEHIVAARNITKTTNTKTKEIGGENNGGTREVLLTRNPKSLLTEQRKTKLQLRRKKVFAEHKRHLRPSIQPGVILILLSGQHRGKRVIFLKQLASGLLLVSGPYKCNGVPLRRVHQSFVIATKTQIDISNIEIPKRLSDAYFKRMSKDKKLKSGNKVDVFAETKPEYSASQERKDDQKIVDGQIAAIIKLTDNPKLLVYYLRSMFSLGKRDYPHKMIF